MSLDIDQFERVPQEIIEDSGSYNSNNYWIWRSENPIEQFLINEVHDMDLFTPICDVIEELYPYRSGSDGSDYIPIIYVKGKTAHDHVPFVHISRMQVQSEFFDVLAPADLDNCPANIRLLIPVIINDTEAASYIDLELDRKNSQHALGFVDEGPVADEESEFWIDPGTSPNKPTAAKPNRIEKLNRVTKKTFDDLLKLFNPYN